MDVPQEDAAIRREDAARRHHNKTRLLCCSAHGARQHVAGCKEGERTPQEDAAIRNLDVLSQNGYGKVMMMMQMMVIQPVIEEEDKGRIGGRGAVLG